MSYVIDGGAQGKARLSILGQAMNRYSLEVLREAGLSEGLQVLDAGCGGGTMTHEIAHIIGNKGVATGIDFDGSIIELNSKEAADERLANISFRQQDICQLDEAGVYDIIFARFLLSHLSEPEKAVANMVRALKPGGRLVLEDIQFSAHVHYPYNAAMATYIEWYAKVVEQTGGDAERGLYLHQYLVNEGLEELNIRIAQPVGTSGPAKIMSLVTLEKIGHALLEHRITNEECFRAVLEELRLFTNDPTTVISIPRVFQVWATRPPGSNN